MNVIKCKGEGQGSCKRCSDKGKWNRTWMCFLYRIEGYDGCYCGDCVKEIEERERLIGLLAEVGLCHYGMIADYLLENGVIVPPCKVGDTVWAIRDYKGVKHPRQGVVSEMFFTRDMKLMIVVKMIARGHWGKTVFLSKEEAEKALRGENNAE